jgi:ubiquitin C-terminal hydrolase
MSDSLIQQQLEYRWRQQQIAGFNNPNVKLCPSGIYNPGNFCYIISAIQTLKTLRPLLNFFEKQAKMDIIYDDIIVAAGITTRVSQQDLQMAITRLSDEFAVNPNILQRVALNHKLTSDDIKWYLEKIYKENTKIYLYIMIKEFIKALNGETKTFTPNGLIRVIASVFNDFGMAHLCNGAQNDAQEFITVLLDYLCDSHSLPSSVAVPKAVLDMPEKELDSIQDLTTRIKYGLLREINLRYSKEFTSLNSELYFYNLNQIRCPGCGFSSLSYCPNNMLCIPLPDRKDGVVATLYGCLDMFFDLEMLDGDYPCSSCQNKKDMGIRRYILTKPKTLIICLKRFNFDPLTMAFRKDNQLVVYPEVLDIRKYNPIADQDPENTQYRLTGIINHSGAINFGHYYSWNLIGNKWWEHNDALVSPIPCLSAENPSAYILTYEKMT